MTDTYLALLRGINVGGKNQLPMNDLKEIFAAAGCADVRTYIQSGNVIFRASPEVSRGLADRVAWEIETRFGYRATIILRYLEQLRALVACNPFLAAGLAGDTLHVMFLADFPSAAHVQSLDPNRSPPDAFHVLGQEIFLHLPKGVSQSKLTNQYFDSKLHTTSTSRNWRTVTKLLALMEA